MFGQLLATASYFDMELHGVGPNSFSTLMPLATITSHPLPDRFYMKHVNMQKQISLRPPFHINLKSEGKEYILVEIVTELLSIKA